MSISKRSLLKSLGLINLDTAINEAINEKDDMINPEKAETLRILEIRLDGMKTQRNLLKQLQDYIKNNNAILTTADFVDNVERFVKSEIREIEENIQVDMVEIEQIKGFDFGEEQENNDRKRILEVEHFGE